MSIVLPANGGILAGNPYQPIATRNVFGLNAVSLPQPPAQPPVPLVKISLVGLTTILGPPDVLFKASNPAWPGKPEKYYILGEGQVQDDIQIVSVDAKNGIVTFRNHGVVQPIQLSTGTVASSH